MRALGFYQKVVCLVFLSAHNRHDVVLTFALCLFSFWFRVAVPYCLACARGVCAPQRSSPGVATWVCFQERFVCTDGVPFEENRLTTTL